MNLGRSNSFKKMFQYWSHVSGRRIYCGYGCFGDVFVSLSAFKID